MNYSRKQFLQLGSGTIGALYFSPLVKSVSMHDDPRKLKTFGLQLYTLRDILLNEPNNILKRVASFGYKQIESYEGPKGMFWGMSHSDFKKTMDDLGMTIISSHCDINKDFEKKADEASSIGMKYLLSSSFGYQKKKDDYKKLSDQFNHCAKICKTAGIRFAYHGEDDDFKLREGYIPHDLFMQNSDPAFMDFQMDIYWVITGGQDPETLLKRYPNRFRLCHIKDRIKGATERDASCDLGTGSIDFTRILKAAKQNGMQYYIAEQERYDGTTPMKAVEADARFMKKLKI